MRFDFNFQSSILLIFFVHGLVYALLLFNKSIRNENPSDKWLSIFLVLCILYITPWMVGFAGWYDHQPYRDILFYTPFQHLFFIGPVIFFYVQSLLNPGFKFGKKEMLHFIPGILYFIFCIIMFVTDVLVKDDYYFLADQEDPDFDTWYQLAGYVSMIFYFISSLRYYSQYKRLLLQVSSNAYVVLFTWVRNFLIAFLAILITRFFLFILSFMFALHYWQTWWYFVAFAITFYYIAITGYANSAITKISFKVQLFTSRPPMLLQYNIAQPVEDAEEISIDEEIPTITIPASEDDATTEWKQKLLQAVVTGGLYQEPELSLTDLAKKMGSNAGIISRAVNSSFKMNFNDFINYYRVQAVIEKLNAGEQKTQTLLGIAYDCGFNSKATFNRAFKKVTHKSPKEWLQAIAAGQ